MNTIKDAIPNSAPSLVPRRQTMHNLPHRTDSVSPPQAKLIVKLAVIIFVILYISLALLLVADSWVGTQRAAHWFMGNSPGVVPADFLSGFYSIIGALLGCGVLEVVSFHKYVAVKRDFRPEHVWGYFVAPWLAAVLGLVVFALLQTGLLVFSGGGSSSGIESKNPAIANLGFLLTGFLAGFGWYDMVLFIRRMVQRFFHDSNEEGFEGRDDGITARIAREDEKAHNEPAHDTSIDQSEA